MEVGVVPGGFLLFCGQMEGVPERITALESPGRAELTQGAS